MAKGKIPSRERLDRLVATAQRRRLARLQGYRERALQLFPWVCGRCGREFTRSNVRELTVHHRDHDHRNNPDDGSNWELLCIYCHEDEHARSVAERESTPRGREPAGAPATHKGLSGLADLLKGKG